MTVAETFWPSVIAAPVGTDRLMKAAAPDFASHLATFGPLPQPGRTPELPDLLDVLRDAGLEGRGGAAFPAWRKLAAVPARERARGHRVVVIGNAAEGEPLSSKDATLLMVAPHLVIDGLLLLAQSVHAKAVYLYAQRSTLASVSRALGERRDARGIELREAADSFISGEASAVVSALAGGRPVPQDRTVRLTETGLGGRPTLLHNVETLAHMALIRRFGAAWFRSVGTASDPGTRLVTVHGGARPPSVLEIAGGTGLHHVLRFAGIDPAGLSAVLVGGFHGAWVPASAGDVRLDREHLAPFGAGPGAGILLAQDARHCPLSTASSIATFLAGETAGQCGPCVNGLPAMAGVLSRLTRGERDAALVIELRRLAHLVTGRGSCNHPDGTARFVLSTLTVFDTDVQAHLSGTCRKEHS